MSTPGSTDAYGSELSSGVVLLFMAVVYGLAALDLPAGDGEPGPGFLPLVLAVLLGALSIGIVVGGLRRGGTARSQAPAPELGPPSEPRLFRPAQSWIAVVAAVAYALLFEALGFVLSTALFSAIVTGLFTRERRALLAVPALVTVALFVLFRLALQVRLPSGPFG